MIFIQGHMVIEVINRLVLNTLGLTWMHHLNKQKS